MRTTDPDPQPCRPLGERAAPAPAPPAAEAWQRVPGAPRCVEQDAKGRLRTAGYNPDKPLR